MSQQPTARSPLEGPVLYRRGSVYTTVDPGASALIAEGDQVVWVGSEQAADSLQDERMQVVELDGRLIRCPGPAPCARPARGRSRVPGHRPR